MPSNRVAIEAGEKVSSQARPTVASEVVLDSELERIFLSPALLTAFAGFCQRALCSESLQFLIEALEFEKSLRTATAPNDATEFDTFMGIVDKYIRDNSPFEVNIDSKTKRGVLAMTEEAIFKGLTLVSTAFRKLEI